MEDWQIESKMDALQVNALRLREIDELKRVITLKNRAIKRLESKVDRLHQEKELTHVKAENERLKKTIIKYEKRNWEF